MTNLTIQQAIVDALGFIDYWDTVNSLLSVPTIILIVLSILATFVTFMIVCGDEDPNITTKDRAQSISFTATLLLVTCGFVGALCWTPSTTQKEAQLPLLVSQLVLDDSTCYFIKNLYNNNKDFRTNTEIPKACKIKDIDAQ